MHRGFPHLSVARREHRSLPPTVQLRWAFRAGSRRLRAAILIIRTSWRHRSVGCSRVCLPSGVNLEGSRLSQLEKHLTRRANHRHINIIAKIVQVPGGEIRGGLFVAKNSNRAAAACHDASSPNARRLGRRGRAAVRTFEIIISRHARTCRRAAWCRSHGRKRPCSRDTVRA